MLNFKSLSTIFKYDYTKLFDETLPKGNDTKIDSNDHLNVVTGTIIILIAKILFFFVASLVIVKIGEGVYKSEMTGFNMLNTFQVNWTIFVLPVLLGISEFFHYKDTQPSYMALSLTVWCFIQLCYCLYLILVWFVLMFINAGVPIFGLFVAILEIIGYLFVITGYMEFARKNKQKYIDDNKPEEKISEIKTSAIGLDDITMHVSKKCKNCNSDLDNTSVICNNCGTRVE